MALVALLGSDRFAVIGGAIAMVLGPLVYVVVRGRKNGRVWRAMTA